MCTPNPQFLDYFTDSNSELTNNFPPSLHLNRAVFLEGFFGLPPNINDLSYTCLRRIHHKVAIVREDAVMVTLKKSTGF